MLTVFTCYFRTRFGGKRFDIAGRSFKNTGDTFESAVSAAGYMTQCQYEVRVSPVSVNLDSPAPQRAAPALCRQLPPSHEYLPAKHSMKLASLLRHDAKVPPHNGRLMPETLTN